MRLSSFSVYRYKLPLVDPIQMERRMLYRREGLLLRMASAEGDVGWGEAAPLPGFSREHLQQATRQAFKLKRLITGRQVDDDWVGADSDFLDVLDDDLDLVPSVYFGLEQAALTMVAAARGCAPPHLLVDEPRPTVALCGLLTGERNEVLETAQAMREDGYRAVKLKVGRRELEEEIALVRELSGEIGPDMALRLDANRAWTTAEARQFASGIDGVALDFFEEPLEDPSGLPALAEETGWPLALDETMRDVSLVTLDRHTYARAVVLKPTLLGGFSGLVYMANKALELGLTPVLSSAYESGIGMMGLVTLAACLEGDAPIGAGTYRWIEQDVVRPRLKLSQARVNVEETVNVKRTMNGHLLREV